MGASTPVAVSVLAILSGVLPPCDGLVSCVVANLSTARLLGLVSELIALSSGGVAFLGLEVALFGVSVTLVRLFVSLVGSGVKLRPV